jgi:hypothetical protein
MKTTWIALALVLIVAGQLIVLSSFHEVNEQQGFSNSNAVITIAKLNYVDARVTITILPMPTTGSTNESCVEIVFPDGTTLNLTSAWKVYTKTFGFPRTGDSFGNYGGGVSNGNNSVLLSQDEPLVVSVKFNVNDPQSYVLPSEPEQTMQISTFMIYGAATISVSGYYGVAL